MPMRELVREYVLPAAAGLLAAAVTAFAMAGSLRQQSDRLDEAADRSRREIESVPEDLRELTAHFLTRRAELERRLAVIEELSARRADLVGAAKRLLRQVPEGVAWVRLGVNSREVGMIFDSVDALTAVRLAEAIAADPGQDLVDLEISAGGERPGERFYLSARLVPDGDDGD